jgi:ectoine hydroxylase-related dioxygenase (phytanoyl-CoA dioxygenase family)
MHAALLRHLHDGVAAAAAHVLGASSVRLLQDALLLKQPSDNSRIALHQDYTYTGYLDPPDMLAVGLALNDAPAESGCLHVVDGSHTWGLVGDLRIFAGDLQQDLGDLLSPAQREVVDHRRIPLEVCAGDVTIHHCLTLHGSDSNLSRAPRKTIVTHLFAGDCRLAADRLPASHRHHFLTDDQGRLTGPGFPLLYP